MNCNTCRYELSQCLDGRLPSGRRTVVMQHVAECGSCAAFWSELQAAQQMTLLLPKERVSEGFREELWERIRAGEGTPEAVFHEPVPLLTKARYALTGAAAAAAVLLCSNWFRDGGKPAHETPIAQAGPEQDNNVHNATDNHINGAQARRLSPRQDFVDDQTPAVFAQAQPLTADLVAMETARQFEQRYVSANRSLALLNQGDSRNDKVVGRLLDSANELHLFAEVLLDLRDNGRVSFDDAEIVANLKLVSNLLGQTRGHERNVMTVQTFVAPALRQSDRLGNIARLITLRPAYDPIEENAEQEMLRQLGTLRPDIFSKLFFVFPSNTSAATLMLQKGELFVMNDQCGPNLVAPRSRVEESNQRLRTR